MSRATDAHAVSVEGEPLRSFNSRAAALTYGRSKVYLSQERVPAIEALLDAGKVASWQYGFASVDIYPGVP